MAAEPFFNEQTEQSLVKATIVERYFHCQPLANDDELPTNRVAIGTMHRSKGLQFRAVAVLGAEHGEVPITRVLDKQADDPARQAFLELERNLLYVACSRARERLLVTGVKELSRFLTSS